MIKSKKERKKDMIEIGEDPYQYHNPYSNPLYLNLNLKRAQTHQSIASKCVGPETLKSSSFATLVFRPIGAFLGSFFLDKWFSVRERVKGFRKREC